MPELIFPDIIESKGKIYSKKEDEIGEIGGLNLKKLYVDDEKNVYFAKVDKQRKIEEIFKNSSSLPENPEKCVVFQKHLNELRDSSTATAVIASRIAQKIFPNLVVPDNQLTRFKDGTAVILSKRLPERLNEFLSETDVVTLFKPKKPTDWKGLPSRSDLKLTEEQAIVLGRIYYTALLMGHWDIINNIDLTNSGSIVRGGKTYACIVDWGNCSGIGFGSLLQDGFQNPEFKALNLQSGSDPVTGFIGTVPFDKIVYPKLPRQVVSDLFDLTSEDAIGKAMLIGFNEAHDEAKKNLPHVSVRLAVIETIGEGDAQHFGANLNQELFGDAKSEAEPGLKNILEGRLVSLDGIVKKIEQGVKLSSIADEQFHKIVQSQTPKILAIKF